MAPLVLFGKEHGISPKDKTMFKCIEQAPKGGKWRIRLYFREKPVDKKHCQFVIYF